MRVLLSAYVCRPGSGSEPGTGWEFLRAIAREHEVTLLTESMNVDRIRAALTAEGLDGVTIVAVDAPRLLRRFVGRLGLGHLDYLIWQARAWKEARTRATEVDVAHHITYANDWLPCALHFVRDAPVVWGPVGGTAPMPWRLVRFLSIRGVLSELARELVTRASRRLTSALVRRSGCMVVAMNREVAARFAGLEAPVVVEPHVAVDPVTAPPASVDETASQNGRRALFVGRLLSLKGPYLAIAAMTALPEEWTLDVYGEGPEAAGMRRRAERLGVANRVRLLGQRPREEVRTALQQADVLLFPSMHDSGGWTVAEAVSVGCPVVCLDVCGPPVLIEGTTGEAVPANALAPKRLAEAMIRVRRHPPSDRWSGARLSATVQRWYAQAIAHHTAVTAQHPAGR